jgi:hypothetical protein
MVGGLGGQVAPDEERIGLVELRGRQKLAKDDFGTVKVRGQEQALEFPFRWGARQVIVAKPTPALIGLDDWPHQRPRSSRRE